MRAAILAMLMAGPASAACHSADLMRERLQTRHLEVQIATWIERDQLGRTLSMELWAGPSGSMTILRVAPTGYACVALSGRGFGIVPPAPLPPQGEEG